MSNFTLAGLRNVADELRATYYPKNETEKKVYEALSSLKNWGASTTLLNEIAADTFDYEKYPVVMTTVWNLVSNEGRTWKQLFKALSLLEFLVKSGAERCIEDMRDHMRLIRSLQDYNYYDGNVDKGGGVREKATQLVSLLGNNESIREEREKARRLRDKFVGISSNGYGGSSGGRGSDSYSNYGGSSRDKYSSDSYSGGSSSSSGRYNSRYGNDSHSDRGYSERSTYGDGGIGSYSSGGASSYSNSGIGSSKKSPSRFGGGSYDSDRRSRYSDEAADPLDSYNSPGRNGREQNYGDRYASHEIDAGADYVSKKSSSKIKINIKDSKSSRPAPATAKPAEEVDLFADPTPAAGPGPLFDGFADAPAAAPAQPAPLFDAFSTPAPVTQAAVTNVGPSSTSGAPVYDPFAPQSHYAVPQHTASMANPTNPSDFLGQPTAQTYTTAPSQTSVNSAIYPSSNHSQPPPQPFGDFVTAEPQDFGDFESAKPAVQVTKTKPANDWSNLVNLDNMQPKMHEKSTTSESAKRHDGYRDSFQGLDGFSKPQQAARMTGAPLSTMGGNMAPAVAMQGAPQMGMSVPMGTPPVGYPMPGQMGGAGYFPNQQGMMSGAQSGGMGYNAGVMPSIPSQQAGYNPQGQMGYPQGPQGMMPGGSQQYRF